MGLSVTSSGTVPTSAWDEDAMRFLGDRVLDVVDHRTFEEGIGADGLPIGTSKKGTPIRLVKTGLLRARMRVTRASATKAFIGPGRNADIRYAYIVNARFPFLGLSPVDEELVSEAVDESVAAAMARSAT